MILPPDFYAGDTIDVARELLGKRIVRILPNGKRLSGRIVETEAYLGVEDPAAHTFGGRRTERNEAMYGEAGHAYIYFIYGLHYCLNVVTQKKDVPEAVLLRALEPVEGGDYFLRSQKFADPSKWLNGPAKLCSGLEITRELNGISLFKHTSKLFIEDDISISGADILGGPRIGVDYAGDAAFWPLRFGVRHSTSLSPKRFDN
jgi:DNA-3-methyladenine glycosylase